jgi:drug/metabolite transporter (DMT)-like permease
MFYIPILGAVLDAVGAFLNKKLAVKKDVGYREFLFYSFLSIILVSLPFLYFFWDINPLAGRNRNMAILALIVIFSFFANYFSFFALKNKNLSKLESIRLTLPLLTILIAFLFSFIFDAYKDERNYYILFFALIASLALFFSNVKKEYFYMDKYSYAALAGSFLFAVELTLSKLIIEFYHPFSFYFIRCLFIFIISLSVFRKKVVKIKNKSFYLFMISALFWVGYRVLLYYGYNLFGVIFTTTVFILSPVLVYTLSAVFLKEKISFRQISSSIIIVLCIIGALFFETKSL